MGRTNAKPVPPPGYRPQPTPKVLQAKMKAQSPMVGNAEYPTRPKAPPVYRLQPQLQVMQRKSGRYVQRKTVGLVIQRMEGRSEEQKQQDRFEKANAIMQVNDPIESDTHPAMVIKSKVVGQESEKDSCSSSEPLKMKVLIISDAMTTQSKYPEQNTLSKNFPDNNFDVTATWYDNNTPQQLPPKFYNTKTDMNQPSTFPPQQFDMILARNVFCLCGPSPSTTCGGIKHDVGEAVQALNTVAQKMSGNPKARAYLTTPSYVAAPSDDIRMQRFKRNEQFLGEAIEKFNAGSSEFIALPMRNQGNFYGIKLRRRKEKESMGSSASPTNSNNNSGSKLVFNADF
jgi:hypothetical protein